MEDPNPHDLPPKAAALYESLLGRATGSFDMPLGPARDTMAAVRETCGKANALMDDVRSKGISVEGTVVGIPFKFTIQLPKT